MMERPFKRPRLSLAPEREDESTDFDLQEARAHNDMRLKSIFEGIFKKYGRDFTDVGDEIDLQTGDILVNNGHIGGMNEEDNPEEAGDWLSDPDSSTPSISQPNAVIADSHSQYLDTKAGGDFSKENSAAPLLRPISVMSKVQPAPGRESLEDEASNLLAESDDDTYSVDSLLDTALRVQNVAGGSSKIKTVLDRSKPVTEKANTTDQASTQLPSLHVDGLSNAVDPVWWVPEISERFSTPSESRSGPKPTFTTILSQSPPGAGSLWALPGKSKRNTDVTKGKSRKSANVHQQKKYRSSPVMCDWSFAETPDGSESDDPLQEDYEPSPTPRRALYIREKRRDPYTVTRTTNSCDFCKQSFSSGEFIAHLRAVLSSSDDRHDRTEVKKLLNTATGNQTSGSRPGPAIDIESPHSGSVNTSISKPHAERISETNPDFTPTKSKRARTIIEPEEARLIIRMRQVHGRKWKEILDHFPHKKLVQLTTWKQTHWNDRLLNPPRLSKPWSETELDKLRHFKEQTGLTWPVIRAELPGRSHAEIEFELLQLWADDVKDNQTCGPGGWQGGQEATEAEYSPHLQRVDGADRFKNGGSEISPTAPSYRPVTVTVAVTGGNVS